MLDAVARGAAEALGAVAVAVIGRDGDRLRVLAAAGIDVGHAVGDEVAPTHRSVGYVMASGQTMSLGPQADETQESGGVHRAPGALLSVPCLGGEGVLGVIEIRGGPGVEPFSPDATRVATLFAEIAAAALEEAGDRAERAPGPAELGAELARLAEVDPNRYSAIASTIGALLAHG